jgi:branched-chain amino acid transport system substrate-binding protein
MQFRTTLVAAAAAVAVGGTAGAQNRSSVGHLMDNSGPTVDVGVPFGQGVADALAGVNRVRNGVAGR